MKKIIKIKIVAIRNVRVLVDRHKFELPAGNCIWLNRPSYNFIVTAEALERDGYVELNYIYSKEKKTNWKKEGF